MLMKTLFCKIRNKLILNATRQIVREENERILWKLQDFVREECERLYQHNTELANQITERFNRNDWLIEWLLPTKISRLFSINVEHQKSFSNWKNKFREKNIVIVGAGPSVNDFEPIPNAIYIGLNRAFLQKKVDFDILFAIDKAGIQDYYEEFFNYRNGTCIKFIGDQTGGEDYQIPESKIFGEKIFRYKTTANYFENRFTYDIATEPLGNFVSVSLQALQFALYTNPVKIYLVGIDCSSGHFTGTDHWEGTRSKENDNWAYTQSIEDYKSLKNFAKTYYPDTEIISVNPVGLKGIFKDWYQDEGDEPK